MAIIWRYEHNYANVVYNTTQHNITQQQLVVKVEYIGKKNVFPTTDSEGGIYLHVLEDR